MQSMVPQRTVTLTRPRRARGALYGAYLVKQREEVAAGIPLPQDGKVERLVACQHCGKVHGTFVSSLSGHLVHLLCMSGAERSLWELNRKYKRRQR